MVLFEKEKEKVCQLYQLINSYSVPISSEDQIAFAQLEPSMNQLRSLVRDALSFRDSTVEEFLTSLNKDVTDLSCKLEKLKPKLLVKWKMLRFFVVVVNYWFFLNVYRIHSSLTSIQIFYKCVFFLVTFGSPLMSCRTWPRLTPPSKRNSRCFNTTE